MIVYISTPITSADQAAALPKMTSDLVELPQNMKRPGRCYQHRDPGPDRHGRTAMEDRTGTSATEESRFWVKVQKLPSGYWEWTASRNPDSGYGRFQYGGKLGYAHRWVYEHFVGPIPDGATIDHLCRNYPCVNPDHLDAVSQLENNRRGPDRPSARGQVTETCIRGHVKTPDNVYRHGTRYHCMTCRRDEARERYRRNRDAINARRRAKYAAFREEE